ncbi:tubulin polyglutamylase complex subunit 1 [Microcaecilia unicolor]|uniref:Tubulin polyglutamylase complex subunit 1 n=1 Tax=Microcaecilia unicolor TaxID=1415580 RepID=A0A6P7Z1H3_9AMPH|nr:tubulin polyglutamylase complex subunit 1 [Microcaecilia unicolor]
MMAASPALKLAEKRRPVPVAAAAVGPVPAGEAEFLRQVGVTGMLREALLTVLEARPEEPVAFLADYFEKLALSRAEETGGEVPGPPALQQQRLDRAIWYLRLAHYSQRTAFHNNVSMAYECLSIGVKKKRPGVNGRIYSEVLRRICREGEAPEDILSLLLKKIQCRDYEAVPYDVFRYSTLTCFVLLEFISKANSLYHVLDDSGQADKRVCQAVLGTLGEAIMASDLYVPTSYLEAGSKLRPDCLALAMDKALLARRPSSSMSRREFLSEAAVLFLTKVKPIN